MNKLDIKISDYLKLKEHVHEINFVNGPTFNDTNMNIDLIFKNLYCKIISEEGKFYTIEIIIPKYGFMEETRKELSFTKEEIINDPNIIYISEQEYKLLSIK
jgi:hypothetical protein